MSLPGARPTCGPWLTARNPTVKLGVLLAVSLTMLVLFDPGPLVVLYLLALLAVRVAGVPARTLALGQVPFLLFGLGLVMVNASTRPGRPLLEDTGLPVTVEGLTVGAALALRGLVVGVLAIGFLASTPPRELLVSLVQHARLSPRYAYALLAAHRMLGAMPGTWTTLRAAHAVRAPLRDGRPRPGTAAAARAAFGLLAGAVRASERTALALESRGLGRGARTVWRPVPIGRADALLAAAVLSTVAAVTTTGVWWP